MTVEHTDLVRRRHDVREHQGSLVGDALGKLVQRSLRERRADVLGLRSVDEVAEDPATAAEALTVTADAAVAATPAGGDARYEHAIARLDRLDGRTDLLDDADRLVPEDSAVRRFGHIALEDVQVGTTDGHRLDADDRVLGI
jgi:hypothetical protein